MTLIVQVLVFAAFVWFTMKFVWPPLAQALEERQNKIADGLSAGERGRKELELAQHRIKDEMKQAKAQVAEILERANRQASKLIEEAKESAKCEVKLQVEAGQEQIRQAENRAREDLRQLSVQLAVNIAEKILMHKIDDKINSVLLDQLIEEL